MYMQQITECSTTNHYSPGRWVARLYRSFQDYLAGAFRNQGFGAGQVPLLRELSREAGLRQEELAVRAGLDRTTVARTIRCLDEAGLIRRDPDPTDRRAYCISLTDAGQRTIPHLREALKRWSEILTQGFDEEEKRRFMNLLERAAANAGRYMNGTRNS